MSQCRAGTGGSSACREKGATAATRRCRVETVVILHGKGEKERRNTKQTARNLMVKRLFDEEIRGVLNSLKN